MSVHTMWHTIGHTRKALNVLHVLCTRRNPDHLSVHVRDSLRGSEEVEKILNCTFQSDYYYQYYYYHYYYYYYDVVVVVVVITGGTVCKLCAKKKKF